MFNFLLENVFLRWMTGHKLLQKHFFLIFHNLKNKSGNIRSERVIQWLLQILALRYSLEQLYLAIYFMNIYIYIYNGVWHSKHTPLLHCILMWGEVYRQPRLLRLIALNVKIIVTFRTIHSLWRFEQYVKACPAQLELKC